MIFFNNPKSENAFGSFGEFTVGRADNTIRVKYLLTKIKPGNTGTWECVLASRMRPWREVFKIDELTFDELLQRDLNDSRVAHELIPYLLSSANDSDLLSDSRDNAKFFPPILATIAPRKDTGSGIKRLYPSLTVNGEVEAYGDLFDFEQLKWADQLTPFAHLRFNNQRSEFIIVDGQHRAMAVLALQRQLTGNWEDTAKDWKSYYQHIKVTQEEVKGIELPVCLLFFPDLHEGNPLLQDSSINLMAACREIFLVVNKNAQHVSRERQILLDDEDIAARLTRQTLSTFRDREQEADGLARIYSFSYGDSDTEVGGRRAVTGHLEYSSAIALHKIHSVLFFGNEDAFGIAKYANILDQRTWRSSLRPIEILNGTIDEECQPLVRKSGKTTPRGEVAETIEKLGKIADTVLVRLFDRFRPFTVHNSGLRHLRRDIKSLTSDPENVAFKLIFETSGRRSNFVAHFHRLKELQTEHKGQGTQFPHEAQTNLCQKIQETLDDYVRQFHQGRVCRFFYIDDDLFTNANELDQRELIQKTRILFETLSTQAFQIGYAMAIFTVVEEVKNVNARTSPLAYEDRLALVEFVTETYLAALNTYFTPKERTIQRILTSYNTEPCPSVFDIYSFGLRGLLAMSVRELNEQQWRFFRYALLEIVHSSFCWEAAQSKMEEINDKWAGWYKAAIEPIVRGILSERAKYIDDAVKASVKGREYELERTRVASEARGAGKSSTEIEQILEVLKSDLMRQAKKDADKHLKSSLKKVETEEEMIWRLKRTVNSQETATLSPEEAARRRLVSVLR